MKQGDQIQDRYLLEERLGIGGMAEVWRAQDQRLERSVAIKFLAPQLTADPEFLVRFFSEAQSVARISHPNVVSVLDFGEVEGSPCLVMEYVPGGAVSELTGGPLQADRAAEIVRDAALGAGAAHELGIVHRDIKPGNILLCDDGRATIADFGIALSAFSEKLTATGQVIGSPHYIAPEQASGKGSRPESDVYALGIVLYELLTGRPPFDAGNATAIAIAHVDEAPEPPSARGADVGPELDALVLRCLAKDPAERFGNGAVLASALEDAVPSIAGLAPVLGSAALAGAMTADGDTGPAAVVDPERPDTEVPDSLRRVLTAAGAVVMALLLGAGAWAMLRNEETTPSVASASESNRGNKKPRPGPSGYEDSEGNWVATNPTATPTPATDENEDGSAGGDRAAADRAGGDGHDGQSSNTGELEEEETTEATPAPTSSPAPEEEETTEPTPAPSEPPE